jgi:hypothetical protein
MYRDAAYSFVSITDHNRVTRCDELNDEQFLSIPGTEDTVSQILPPLGPHMARLFVDEPLRVDGNTYGLLPGRLLNLDSMTRPSYLRIQISQNGRFTV